MCEDQVYAEHGKGVCVKFRSTGNKVRDLCEVQIYEGSCTSMKSVTRLQFVQKAATRCIAQKPTIWPCRSY